NGAPPPAGGRRYADAALALRVLPRLLHVRLLLARHGIAGSRERLQRRHRDAGPRAATFDSALWQARHRALARAGARIPGTHCLARSLALWHWLGGEGLRAELRIGVRVDHGNSHAHAWVEHAGQPIGEAGDIGRRFTPLAWTAVDQVLAAGGAAAGAGDA